MLPFPPGRLERTTSRQDGVRRISKDESHVSHLGVHVRGGGRIMFAGQSMGKAFRPSRFSNELEPQQQAEDAVDRERRIRRYARRVRLRAPLFDRQPVAEGRSEALAGA